MLRRMFAVMSLLTRISFVPTVSECSSSEVFSQTGQDVTLSCKYDIRNNGPLHMCWGRGEVPAAGCNDQLVSTDGYKVIKGTRASSRYQLLGRLDKGDVSLTILSVTESDSGTYSCRVEIPGWFNDEKHYFKLHVERGEERLFKTSCRSLNR